MKAVTLTSSRQIRVVEKDVPTCGERDVLVQPWLCGICGSDLHAAQNEMYRTGVTLGHEFSGEVVAVGAAVEGWVVGDRVAVNPNGNVCGSCAACAAGRYNLCHVGTRVNALGVARDGGLAPRVVVSPRSLHRIPDLLHTAEAAWVEPLAVAVRAVRTAQVPDGANVAVIGAGPVGQLITQLLCRRPLEQVTVVEPSVFRQRLVDELTGSLVITPGELAARRGTSFDCVFECSGHPAGLEAAVDSVSPGGTVRLVGLSTAPVQLDVASVITREVAIGTSFIYVDEFDRAISLLSDSEVEVGPLTTAVLPVHQVSDALAMQGDGRTMKVLLDVAAGGGL